MNSSMIRE